MKDAQINISLVSLAEEPDGCDISRWEIYRWAVSQPKRPPIKVAFTCRMDAGEADPPGLLTLVVGTIYEAERPAGLRRRLLTYTVRATFDIENLRDTPLAGTGSVNLPPHLLKLMLSTTIGAIRGMLVLRTSGTPLAKTPLPLVNVTDLVSSIIYNSPTPRGVLPFSAGASF